MKKLASLFLVLAACAPPYVIIRQAQPSPFTEICSLQLDPVHFEGMRVGDITEDAWMAHKNEREQHSFGEDKRTMNENFNNAISERVGPRTIQATAPFILVPRVLFYEPGFYGGVVARDTQVDMQIAIVDAKSNREVDVVESSVLIPSNLINPSTGGRFRSAGKQLGALFSRYLAERLGGCAAR